ncbi:putative oxidoreductase [Rhodococcus rhodnii LMG 5362]|uniref:Putative oxidoreductase n=1 Tax=Rhodococcus rhodnii LMG 5362 TaxID=1273125 RepID=R7WRR6_9NOCA|nr:putative oxidoreductase [Rhodococcus rhodnii LMG 5362]
MPPIHAVELAETGVHPAAWRRADSRAEEVFTARYWTDAITALDDAGADIAFLPDPFVPPAPVPGSASGALEAVAIAARVSALTRRIALVPTATVTHTEPFHVSKAIATLDFTTLGRAGWQVDVSRGDDVASHVGRGPARPEQSLWAEAADAIDVVTRLWDSWEDDAEIRDVATGRFVDRDKLHYVDFVGEYFSVKGPSITPRPPQGRPPVVIGSGTAESVRTAAALADVVRVSAPSVVDTARVTAEIHDRAASFGRVVRVLVDVETIVAPTRREAETDLDALESIAQRTYEPSSLLYVGDGPGLAALTGELVAGAGVDGVTYRPLALASGVRHLARDVLPLVQPVPVPGGTLRERLGLARPVSVFAAAAKEIR